MRPRGVDLDITEQRKPDQPLGGDTGYTVVVPNHCVLNGLPVLIPSGVPIEIEASDDNVVTARLTVMVHRLRIHPEHEPPADDLIDPPIFRQLEAEIGPAPLIAGLIFAAKSEVRDLERIKQQIAEGRPW